MRVKDYMTKDVITLKRSTTLAELIEFFRKYNFHTFPVVENDNRLVGIVTFEDIMKIFQPYSSDLVNMLKTIPFLNVDEREDDLIVADISSDIGLLVVVDDVMNKQLITVDEDAFVTQARALMRLHNIGRLPVVRGNRLTGIISLFDIILGIFKEKGVVK